MLSQLIAKALGAGRQTVDDVDLPSVFDVVQVRRPMLDNDQSYEEFRGMVVSVDSTAIAVATKEAGHTKICICWPSEVTVLTDDEIYAGKYSVGDVLRIKNAGIWGAMGGSIEATIAHYHGGEVYTLVSSGIKAKETAQGIDRDYVVVRKANDQ